MSDSPLDLPVNSKEGIEYIFRWARAHGVVLNEWHERIAKRYGVETDGVVIARPIPQ
nr:hypothetical protein [Mesorhizobium sp.]